jgi:hypothetical protein
MTRLNPNASTPWLAAIALVAAGGAAGTETEEPVIGAGAEGQACTDTADCAAGLACQRPAEGMPRVCTVLPDINPPPGSRGDPCTRDSDCIDGLACGNQGFCTLPGRRAGEACGLSTDCAAGLICLGVGVCGAPDAVCNEDGAVCPAGTADCTPCGRGAGDTCGTILGDECRRPLVCAPTKQCEVVPFFTGPDCSRSDRELGNFRVYFEIPDLEDPATAIGEFDRLPFPNDIRIVDGRLTLRGFPKPGEAFGIDVAGAYLDSLEQDARGYATNQPVFFRFSTPLVEGPDDAAGRQTVETFVPAGAGRNVFIVDVTKTSPEYAQRRDVQIAYGKDRTQYICQNWLGVSPLDGAPLRFGTTYAAVVLNTVRGLRAEEAPVHEPDFAAMLAAAPPVDDAVLAGAWEKHAALRQWLEDDAELAPADLAAASVFTVGDPTAVAAKLRDAVRAAPAPTLDVIGSCPDVADRIPRCGDREGGRPGRRGCTPVEGDFFELQGVYTQTTWQQGERPYRLPGNGGGIKLEANGAVTPGPEEEMCFTLTVPRGGAGMPAGGWPVVIYAHGTGGDFRSGLFDGTAALFSDVRDEQGQTMARFAVLSFDNVGHGPRQGNEKEEDPSFIFFNALNPRASRDNILQGAADLFTLVRLIEGFGAQDVAGLGQVRLDASNIFLRGHSQGTVIAPPFLAYEPNVRATVLSGAGAEVALSILEKKKPTDPSFALGAVFGDMALTRVHPLIGLLAQFFAPSDAVNYAHLWARAPGVAGRAGPQNVLLVYGLNDLYTPESTQAALLRVMGGPIVAAGAAARPVAGVDVVAPPVQAGPAEGTVFTVQYAPHEDYDGHFVSFRRDEAARQLARYLASAVGGRTPVVAAPR